MAERTLIAAVRPDEQDPDTLLVTSPAVGVADGAPAVGTFLNPLDRVLTLRILNRRFVLRLPRDTMGRVREAFVPNEHTPVAFGAPLVRLDPRALAAGGGDGGEAAAGEGGEERAGADVVVIPAPTEGIFYRRSGPDAPPYVEPGATVTPGTVLGLVEVMKCFNQVTYDGPGLPAKGEVVKILVEDAAEVRFGQDLFWIAPRD
jgi:biotin carboxyl carrier protein